MSSDTRAFFRAQGPPLTLELPLPIVSSNRLGAERSLRISEYNERLFDSDFLIREMANRLGLHKGFGPAPSVEMLLQELAMMAREALRVLPMEEPVPVSVWNPAPANQGELHWFPNLDKPCWGNNAETSTSTGARLPRLQIMTGNIQISSVSPIPAIGFESSLVQNKLAMISGLEVVPYNQDFARRQILQNLHACSTGLDGP